MDDKEYEEVRKMIGTTKLTFDELMMAVMDY